MKNFKEINRTFTVKKNSIFNAVCKTRYLALLVVLILTCGNAWGADAQCTLSNTNIVDGGAAASGYGSKTMTDGCSQTWNAYAIKNKHSNATSSYHFLQIRAYNNPTAYYVQVPEKTGYTIKSITMVVSNTSQPRTGGGNSATLFFSASNSTSSAGTGVASGTGSSSVTIDCSSLSLTTGYITASGAVRIWGDIVVTYTPSGAPSKVSTPTFSVAAGTYTGSQSVTISCATASATIHYTTDGTTPTGSSPTYSSAISVDVTQTIKAIAIKDGMTNSDVAEAAYTIKCATPTFSPAAGTYGAVQSVSISTTYGTNIYYTTDGTTPSTSSTLYSSAISVSESQTIKAIAVKTGCSNSEVGEAAYIINLPYTVSFSTGTGNPTQADITEASAGAGITLPDGPTPACSSDGWSFAGWGYESCDDESTEPTLYIAGNKYYPSSNETLYAVYVKGKTASTNYKLISEAAEIVSGENYVIAAYYNSNDYAITAEIQSSYYIKQTAVTVTENVISSPGANIIWLLTNEGGSNVSLYNSNQSKYLYVYASSSYRNLGLYDSKKQFTMTEEREAEYASTFAFNSTDYTSYYINYDASHTDFGTKTSSDENLYLYKRQYTGTYESNPSCEACEKQVTIIKGTPESGGSFDLDKTGEQDCCEPLVVTVSNIVAPSGKQFGAITQSGFESGVTIDQNAKTVTYAANSNGSSTINVTFVDLPKYTVTLEDNGTELTQSSYGAAITLPSRTGCDGYTFAGWTKTWTSPQSTWTTTAPTIIPAGSYTPTADENLYPVYTKTEGGSASYVLTAANAVTAGVYVIGITGTTGYFIATGLTGSTNVDMAVNSETDVTLTDGAFTTLPTGAMELTFTGNNTDGFTISNSGGDKLSYSSYTNRRLAFDDTGKTWKVVESNSKLVLQSNNTDGYYTISQNGTNSIRGYASNTMYSTLFLFKRTGGSTTSYISVPNCCTDWSTPTVSYSSSLAIGGTANVTIGSGTTHGAISYESSNEDILTVESDGTITAVGAGTAHIIATWAGDATYCEKSANSNDITVSGIEITGTLPVNFGQVYQNAVIGDKTLYVTGLGLTNAITPSLPAGSPFSFSPNSFAANADHATLTISASTATIGEYSHTLTLTSGSFTATATINMNVVAMPSCTFVDGLHNLTEDNNHVALSSYDLEAVAGTAVVFPVLADQSKSSGTCEGEYYKFVGWTTSDNNTDPQAHLVTSHTLAIGDNITYHAVWADATGSATYTKLTSTSFSGSPAKYVLGGENSGTQYFLHSYSGTDADVSWGECSSSETPIQFTLSGTAAALVAQDASGNYLAESDAKKKFRMNSSSATVELKDDGTIETEHFYLRYNHNNGLGGLRFYDSESSEPAYFYLVGAAGTVHYRTSCCANKVDAPVVSVTKTSTTITLTWSDDVKATGWEVEWNGAGGWVAPTSTCTYAKTGLTPNTTYTWRVRATYGDPQCGADIASGSTTTDQVYHVSYAPGDESANCTATGSTTDATGYEAEAIVTLQSNGFTLRGHEFNAWTTDDPDVTISSNQFTMPDHDVVITATWTAVVDKYFDRMHDQTDASHGGIVETSGINEGKYYIPKEGCSYDVPTATDRKTGDACQTSHYKLRGWIAASYMKGYPNNMTGEIGTGNESHIFEPTGTKTATGATYYAIWAEVVE